MTDTAARTTNPYLTGNFAPVQEETTAFDLQMDPVNPGMQCTDLSALLAEAADQVPDRRALVEYMKSL